MANLGMKYDAVIIGAGISGMYQLYRLKNLGLSVKVFEAGSDVGGTWYWNRYPGCRFDSESYSYCYSFSKEVLHEWSWSEHFSAQPETLRYLQYVAEKFDLKEDIQFNTRIATASFDASSCEWTTSSVDGTAVTSDFLITAIGALSSPYIPDFIGKESFEGDSWHTSQWPKKEIDLSEKKVGVIGTGATAVQLITEIAKDIGNLTVFQLKPEYCVPLGNRPIDENTQREIKKNYASYFEKCKNTWGSFLHGFDERSALEVSPEEREELFEKLWAEPGFALWLANFHDIFSSREANDLVSDFVRKKIKEQIEDPVLAEKLCPTDHGFGLRRVPMESGYYKVYGQDNVTLVDLNETPIEKITKTGIKTSSESYHFDLIIYATGFDAVTGAFKHIDISGEGGQKLKDKWIDGPSTYLGLTSNGFPNLFTLVGPHNAATFCNIPRCIEQNVEWVTDCIKYLKDNKFTKISAKLSSEKIWTEHVYDSVADSLILETDSWFVGANIPGKKRTFLQYAGGNPLYREKCDEEASGGYKGFLLER